MRSVNAETELHQSAQSKREAKANKNNSLQLDKTPLNIMPVVCALERTAAVKHSCQKDHPLQRTNVRKVCCEKVREGV